MFGVALAAHKAWDGTYSQFDGSHLIYSNSLDEKAPPTKIDKRVSFMVQGSLAESLFDSIGPDPKDACGASADLRIREKGDLSCTRYLPDKRKPYTCHFGMDLRTGKSIAGATC
nr:hypothetical protein [Massilia sp. TS11]